MGAWSESLYGNDFAADVRDALKLVVRLDRPASWMVDTLGKHFQLSTDPVPTDDDLRDGDDADFWLAVADGLHRFGLVDPRVDSVVARLMSGLDVERWRLLDASPASLKKRAKVLAALQEKLSSPLPTSATRKIQQTPDSLVFDPGDVVALPTLDGAVFNRFETPEWKSRWTPNGWVAGIVLATGRTFGMFGWYLTTQLDLLSPARPDLEQVKASRAVLFGTGRLSPRHLKTMRVEHLGRLSMDCDRLIKTARAEGYRDMLSGPDAFANYYLHDPH
ncbi:MAG: hypothetical protein MUF14_08965, partial [Hyphomonadaceae bacterium]|nr:hypothetical protein [Hyphomonadaceae bacterium]